MSEGDDAPSPEEEFQASEFFEVPLTIYRENERIDADLFYYYQRQHIFFKGKGQKWTQEDVQKLRSFGVSQLNVKFASRREYSAFLDSKLAAILDSPDVDVRKKANVLYEISEPILSEVFKTPKSIEVIGSAIGYVKNCIKFVNEKGSIPEMVVLSQRNLTEHTHSLHTAAYAVALGKVSGFNSYDEIFNLGIGALLHDIGKSKIDSSILKKPGELDDSEWQIMRQHPVFGKEMLADRIFVPDLAKRIVLEHHERVNGKGYPRGTKNIHAFSKIVAIADCFNSLTSEREYAKAMKPYDALMYMIQFMRYEFDENLLQKFIELLAK